MNKRSVCWASCTISEFEMRLLLQVFPQYVGSIFYIASAGTAFYSIAECVRTGLRWYLFRLFPAIHGRWWNRSQLGIHRQAPEQSDIPVFFREGRWGSNIHPVCQVPSSCRILRRIPRAFFPCRLRMEKRAGKPCRAAIPSLRQRRLPQIVRSCSRIQTGLAGFLSFFSLDNHKITFLFEAVSCVLWRCFHKAGSVALAHSFTVKKNLKNDLLLYIVFFCMSFSTGSCNFIRWWTIFLVVCNS